LSVEPVNNLTAAFMRWICR